MTRITFILEPEVPGGLGPRTLMDRSAHPPKISRLHLVFDGWLGDHLVESFPSYLVTVSLAETLVKAGVSGFEIVDAEIETSVQFKELYPTRKLPQFKWLKVIGASENDIYLTSTGQLAVSQKVLDLVLATNPQGMKYRKTP